MRAMVATTSSHIIVNVRWTQYRYELHLPRMPTDKLRKGRHGLKRGIGRAAFCSTRQLIHTPARKSFTYIVTLLAVARSSEPS